MEIVELAEERLLLLKQGFGARGWFDSACNAAEVRPRVLLESAAPATLVALADVGHGIAIIPSNVQVVPKSIGRAFLVHRKVPVGRWSSIAWNQHRFLPRYAEDFTNELVAVLQRRYPGRDLIRRAPPLPPPHQ